MTTALAKELVLVRAADDWEGVYLNGKLLVQNHSTDWPRLLEKLSGEWIDFESRPLSEDRGWAWMEEEMFLPEDLDDIPKELFD